MTVAGLVLAAGAGTRIGTPKALLVLDGERLVDRAVRVLAEGGCTPVYVVAGAAPLDVPGATVVDNPAWAEGMGSSLRAGLAVLDGAAEAGRGPDAVVVLPVDTPDLGPAVVRRLVAAYDAGADLVVATYDGQPRNPVLLGRAHWAGAADGAAGDVGARAYLRANPALVTEVDCTGLGDPADLDTTDDWAGWHDRKGRAGPVG